MALLDGPLLLVGGGKMGQALLQGWLDRGLDPKLVAVVEPDAGRRGQFTEQGILAVAQPADLPAGPPAEALVLAVKPQMMAGALPAYRERVGPDTFVLSIAAGKSIASFEAAFPLASPSCGRCRTRRRRSAAGSACSAPMPRRRPASAAGPRGSWRRSGRYTGSRTRS